MQHEFVSLLVAGIAALEIPAINVQPVLLTAGDLVHQTELLDMLDRTEGLKLRGSPKSSVQSPASGRKEKV